MLPSTWRGSLLEDFPFGGSFFGMRSPYGQPECEVMRTDIKDVGKTYVISMDVPGLKKEDISIKLEKGYLTVTAHRSTFNETKDGNDGYIRKERYEGSCSRSFFIGEKLTEKDIKAALSDGILCLSVPKTDANEKETAKQIEIQ